MKLSVSVTNIYDRPVSNTGQSISELINAELERALFEGAKITNVSVDVSEEDMIALRLINEAKNNNNKSRPEDDTYPVQSVKSSFKQRRQEREDILQQHRDGLITDQEKADRLRAIGY